MGRAKRRGRRGKKKKRGKNSQISASLRFKSKRRETKEMTPPCPVLFSLGKTIIT
jgi:hypothetical protein